MRLPAVDSFLPETLVGESVDVRRRARLIVYAFGIALAVDVLTALLMPIVLWPGNQLVWLLVQVSLHLPTLLLLRHTRSITVAGTYYIAVVFAQAGVQFSVSNGLSAFAFIAIPVAAAHLVGLRAAAFWTALSIGATAALPFLVGSQTHVVAMCVGIATITLAIGVASVIVESTRARAVRETEVAEESLRLQRERLRAFVEQTFPCLAEVDHSGLVFVSDGIVKLLGYSPAEAIAAGAMLVRPEDVASLTARLRANPSARTRNEIRAKHKDGHWLWLEIFAIPLADRRAEVRWLFAARNIGDEVEHRERLEQAQRLEGIGALAAGIAHDFNNLLTVIAGYGARLPHSEAREEILRAASSAGELTSQLLAFGRSGPRVEEVIDPERELTALAPVIRSLLGEELEFAWNGSSDGANVRIAQGRFKQVVLNLVTNARDATARGGRVEVTLRNVQLARDAAAEALGLPPGSYLEIAIRDSGVGMSEEVRRHAFDPFFSTKGAQRGSGLGLASAYGIVRRCHGTIALESAEGAGTTARIYLPDAHEAVAPVPSEPRDRVTQVPAQHIWIVEDDVSIQKLMTTALASAGHRVEVVPDGKAALARLEQEGPPRILITDVVMPGMRGTELAARMRAVSPELGVVYISGYSEVEIGDWRSGEQGVHFLAKPFRLAELLAVVEALGSA